VIKKRKIPMRMCVGCNEKKPKKELIRVVKNNLNEVFIDNTGKKSGRGAYLCNDSECFNIAFKNKKFEKTFQLEISEEVFKLLKEQLEDLNE
jgi:predicted RNA-binding protein YlxR (DUF448 family)